MPQAANPPPASTSVAVEAPASPPTEDPPPATDRPKMVAQAQIPTATARPPTPASQGTLDQAVSLAATPRDEARQGDGEPQGTPTFVRLRAEGGAAQAAPRAKVASSEDALPPDPEASRGGYVVFGVISVGLLGLIVLATRR